jgi:hypothetical protein
MKEAAPAYLPGLDEEGRPRLSFGPIGDLVQIAPDVWVSYIDPHATGPRDAGPAPEAPAAETNWPRAETVLQRG